MLLPASLLSNSHPQNLGQTTLIFTKSTDEILSLRPTAIFQKFPKRFAFMESAIAVEFHVIFGIFQNPTKVVNNYNEH